MFDTGFSRAERFVGEAVVGAVPHWYQAECGPFRHRLSFAGGRSLDFFSHRPLSADLELLLSYVNARLNDWAAGVPEYPSRLSSARIGLELALFWLSRHGRHVNWSKVLAYLQELSYRTYEGQQVGLNLLVRPGSGTVDLSEAELQKVLDPLASTEQVALVVDEELRYLDYTEIRWVETEERALGFHPGFVEPIFSMLDADSFGSFLTARRDILVVGAAGMIVSFRAGRWFLYDTGTFRSSLAESATGSWLPANLFRVLFDLSYRGEGALIVYDPQGRLDRRVVNDEAFLGRSTPPHVSVQSLLSERVSAIPLARRMARGERRLVIDIARVDGALIVDDERIRAFGAIIEPHPEARGIEGARETAALSAQLWGASPVKVSADGEITAYFTSTDEEGACLAVVRFM